MGTSLGLCGWPGNGHDIGGFKGPMPDEELLVRWVQSSVFQPRFCIHSWNDGGICTEPWSHPAGLPAVREGIVFRYRLLPYLYALTHEASRTGAPLARPLVYHFPGDAVATGAAPGEAEDGASGDPAGYVRDAASCDYMLGPSVLVAPIYTAGSRARPVYLPGKETHWYEWATGLWHQGGTVVNAAGPLDAGVPPFFVRDGTLLPLLPEAAVGAEHVRGTAELAGVAPELHLFLYKASHARAALVEDDGVSLDTSGGNAVEVTATQQAQGAILLRATLSRGSAPGAPLPYSHLRVAWCAGREPPPLETGLQADAEGMATVVLDMLEAASS